MATDDDMDRTVPVKFGEPPRDAVGGYLGAGTATARSALLVLFVIGVILLLLLAATVDRTVLRSIDAAVTNVQDATAPPPDHR